MAKPLIGWNRLAMSNTAGDLTRLKWPPILVLILAVVFVAACAPTSELAE